MPVKTATATLADHLAQAERGEIKPRERAADRRQALDAAVTAGDFAAAATLKDELTEASAALRLAEATTAALRNGQASVDAERAETDRTVAAAQIKAEAGNVIANAIAGERRGLGEIDSALEQMREHLAAAASAYRAALAWEHRVGEQRGRVVTARVQLGEIPAPGPTPPRPNKASVLADSDPMVAALARWAQ
jgi:hypothetical protein